MLSKLLLVLIVPTICAGSNHNEGSVLSPAETNGGQLSDTSVGLLDWKDSDGAAVESEGKIPLFGTGGALLGSGGTCNGPETGSCHKLDGDACKAEPSCSWEEGTSPLLCPNGCSAHGNCVFADNTYICSCDLGFAGADCSNTFCDQLSHCSGHGSCHFPGANNTAVSSEDRKELISFMLRLAKTERNPDSWQPPPPGSFGCICDEGFTGFTCEEHACEQDCGHGFCEDGTCRCEGGWTGQACEISSCAGNCSGNGHCVEGVCECTKGFTGFNCQYGAKGCASSNGVECSNNGLCREGECWCKGLWTKADCSELSCLSFCSNHGTCHNGECECDSGYAGKFCNYRASSKTKMFLEKNPQCAFLLDDENNGLSPADDEVEPSCVDPKCSGHGACDGVNCLCENGWGGETCADLVCPRQCSGHGTCERDGSCTCADHWDGVSCAVKTCAGGCSGHGKCVGVDCICDWMWGGEACAMHLCPGVTEQCTGHGDCVDGLCHCEIGFYGEKCDLVACPSAIANVTCSGHGLCQMGKDDKKPACQCIGHWSKPYQAVEMWVGEDCSKMACADPKCSGHGRCDDGTCFCLAGYTGDGCQTSGTGLNTGSDTGAHCAKDSDCSGDGKCFEGDCHCKGNRAIWGPHCEKKVIER